MTSSFILVVVTIILCSIVRVLCSMIRVLWHLCITINVLCCNYRRHVRMHRHRLVSRPSWTIALMGRVWLRDWANHSSEDSPRFSNDNSHAGVMWTTFCCILGSEGPAPKLLEVRSTWCSAIVRREWYSLTSCLMISAATLGSEDALMLKLRSTNLSTGRHALSADSPASPLEWFAAVEQNLPPR